MGSDDLSALWLTTQLATISTLILLAISAPLGWWLARTTFRFRGLLEAVLSLPLVLPPSVLGFYLLVMLGPRGPLASVFAATGIGPFSFTFTGLVIGSVVNALPFAVRPIQTAFAMIPPRLMEAAATLGASPVNRFLTVALPLARHGILTGGILGFAHTVGSFGVVLMIGGNIPGQTRVLSVMIYNHVEMMNYTQAHLLSGLLLGMSLILLLAVQYLNRKAEATP